jgi:hypothetical protein
MDDLASFESPKLLIESAKASIPQLESGCSTFIEGCRYEAIKYVDPKTREEVTKLRFQQRVPGALRVSASRILNDLRHALDQAVCDGAILLGRRNSKGVYFPFGRDASDLDRETTNRCKGVNPDLVVFIRKFEAHYGGDGMLYSLGSLAGPNKHQRILRISLGTGGFSFRGEGLDILGPGAFGLTKWNDLRNELEFARMAEGGHFQADFTPTLQLVIGEGEAPLSGPAAASFSLLASKVESIVFGIEAETSRILASRTR